jgi:hypothetical protein
MFVFAPPHRGDCLSDRSHTGPLGRVSLPRLRQRPPDMAPAAFLTTRSPNGSRFDHCVIRSWPGPPRCSYRSSAHANGSTRGSKPRGPPLTAGTAGHDHHYVGL